MWYIIDPTSGTSIQWMVHHQPNEGYIINPSLPWAGNILVCLYYISPWNDLKRDKENQNMNQDLQDRLYTYVPEDCFYLSKQ